MPFLSALSWVVTGVCLVAALLPWLLDSASRVNRGFSAAALAAAVWNGAAAVAYAASDPGVFWPAYQLSSAASALLAPCLFAYLGGALGLGGARWVALAASSAGYGAVLAVADFLVPVFAAGYRTTAWGTVVDPNFGSPWFLLSLGLYLQYLLVLAGLVRLGFRLPSRRLRKLARGFAGALGLAFAANALLTLALPAWGFHGLSTAEPVAGLFLASLPLLVRRYRALDLGSSEVAALALDHLWEPVLIFEPTGAVDRGNPAAHRCWPGGLPRDLGSAAEPAGVLADAWRSVAAGGPDARNLSVCLGSLRWQADLVAVRDGHGDLCGGIARFYGGDRWIDLAETYGLSPRELQVAEGLVRGESNADLAKRLGVSTETVKTHAANLYRKTGSSGRIDLARLVL